MPPSDTLAGGEQVAGGDLLASRSESSEVSGQRRGFRVSGVAERGGCSWLRVMRDVEAVRQEATLLKEQMHTVKEDIKKVAALRNDDVIVFGNDDVMRRWSVRPLSRCRGWLSWTR